MSNKNNVKLSKEQTDEFWKEVMFASSRKSKTGNKITALESVNILKKYFSGTDPILDINSPLPGQNGWTTLYMSAYFGCTDECKALIKMGASTEMFIHNGNSLLHIAAGKNYASLCLVLINNGLNIDNTNLTGKTSLMSACQSGAIDSSRELIENNAATDIIDSENKTCFSYANEFSQKSNDYTIETMLLDVTLKHQMPINTNTSLHRSAIKF